jgi:hypothetical protein
VSISAWFSLAVVSGLSTGEEQVEELAFWGCESGPRDTTQEKRGKKVKAPGRNGSKLGKKRNEARCSDAHL